METNKRTTNSSPSFRAMRVSSFIYKRCDVQGSFRARLGVPGNSWRPQAAGERKGATVDWCFLCSNTGAHCTLAGTDCDRVKQWRLQHPMRNSIEWTYMGLVWFDTRVES